MNRRKIIIQLLMETSSNDTSSSTTNESSILNTSSTNSVTSLSNEEENEDVLLFPLIRYLMSSRKRHRVEDYLYIVDCWTDQEFKVYLRLNRRTALILIKELKLSSYIPTHSFGVNISKTQFFNLFMVYFKYRTIEDYV